MLLVTVNMLYTGKPTISGTAVNRFCLWSFNFAIPIPSTDSLHVIFTSESFSLPVKCIRKTYSELFIFTERSL